MPIRIQYLALRLIFISLVFGHSDVYAEQNTPSLTHAVYLFSVNGEFVSFDVGKKVVTSHGVLSGSPGLSDFLPPYSDPRKNRNGLLSWVEQAAYDQQTQVLILLINVVSGLEGDENKKSVLVSLKDGDFFLPLGYRSINGDAAILLDSKNSKVIVSSLSKQKKIANEEQKILSYLELLDIPKLSLLQRIDESLLESDYVSARKSFSTHFSKDASISLDGRTIFEGLVSLTLGQNNAFRKTIAINSVITPDIADNLSKFYETDKTTKRKYLPFSVSSAGVGMVMLSSVNPKIDSSFALLLDSISSHIKFKLKSKLSRFNVIGNSLLEERLKSESGRLIKTGEIIIRDTAKLEGRSRRIFNDKFVGDELNHRFICGSQDGYFIYLSGDKFLLLDFSKPRKEIITSLEADFFPSPNAQCVFIDRKDVSR